jgi:hypothetical protein
MLSLALDAVSWNESGGEPIGLLVSGFAKYCGSLRRPSAPQPKTAQHWAASLRWLVAVQLGSDDV